MTQHLFHGVVEPLEQLTSYSWRRLLPTVGSLIRLQDAEIVSLGDWQDKVEERVAMPFHYSGGKYALSMRTKMRAFLVAAKVADCEAWETVTEEEVAEADEEQGRSGLPRGHRGDLGPGTADHGAEAAFLPEPVARAQRP